MHRFFEKMPHVIRLPLGSDDRSGADRGAGEPGNIAASIARRLRRVMDSVRGALDFGTDR